MLGEIVHQSESLVAALVSDCPLDDDEDHVLGLLVGPILTTWARVAG